MTRIVPVDHPRPGQRFKCANCREMIDADKAFADLDGTPFEAYYHSGCRPDNFTARPIECHE